MKRLKYNSADNAFKEYLPDCARIVKALAGVGIFVSYQDAYKMWDDYSSMWAASWMILPDTDEEIVEILTYDE